MSQQWFDIPVRWRSWPEAQGHSFVSFSSRFRLLLDLIEKGEPGDAVYCHPDEVTFWSVLPDYVLLETYPDGKEIKKRRGAWDWARKLCGVPSSYKKDGTIPPWLSKFRKPWERAQELRDKVLAAHRQREGHAARVSEAAVASARQDIPLDKIAAASVLAIDSETDTKAKKKPRPCIDPILGISLAWETGDCWIPAEDIPAIREELQAAIEGKTIIGHHAKYDTITTRRLGLDVKFTEDTMLMAYVFGGRYPAGLKPLTRQLLNRPAQELGPLIDRYGSSGQIPKNLLIPYAKADARNTWDCFERLSEQKVDPLYAELEMPISRLLTEMEWRGWRVDKDRLVQSEQELDEEIATATGELENFGIIKPTSNKEVAAFFMGEGFNLPRTQTGFSVDEETLAGIDHPAVAPLLAYRHAHKRKTNWVRAMWFGMTEDGYIHPAFRQVPISGRLSCSNPNVQNFTYGLRSCLVPDPGHVLIAADMSQFELRIMARVSGDPTMLDEFVQGVDIHENNRIALGIERREDAKKTMFGIGYGMDAVKLSEETGRSIPECRSYIAGIYKKYPGLKRYQQDHLRRVRQTEFAYTLAGRGRWLPEVNYIDPSVRGHAERAAFNLVIQGTAADMMKQGMLILEAGLATHGARQLAQIHDEWVISTPNPFATYEALMAVQREFELWLAPVPVRMDVLVGYHWGFKQEKKQEVPHGK